MKPLHLLAPLTFALLPLAALAQQSPQPNPPQPPPPPPGSFTVTVPHGLHSSNMPRSFVVRTADDAGPTMGIVPPGTWWRNQDTIRNLNLTPEQQKKMDDIFRQNRLQLIDIKASLEKEQLNLEPLLNSNPPDQGKALAQISRIADERANLEKENAKMLLALRGVLSADQWIRLQAERPDSMRMLHDALQTHARPGSARHTSTSTTITNCTAKDGQKPVCTTTHGGNGGGTSELILLPDVDRIVAENLPAVSHLSVPALPDLSKVPEVIVVEPRIDLK